VIATAHAITAQITTSPSLRVCDSQPVVIRGDGGAERHRRVQDTRAGRAGVIHADREHREQRPRHPERHRDEVDRKRAEQRLVAAHEPQAVGDRTPDRLVPLDALRG
jgi:hypothetical protein